MRNSTYRDFRNECGSIFMGEKVRAHAFVLRLSMRLRGLCNRDLKPPLLPWTEERWLHEFQAVHHHAKVAAEKAVKVAERRRRASLASLASPASRGSLSRSLTMKN